MSQEFKRKWVAGVVRIDPVRGNNFPFTWFEIDTTDEKTRDFVLSIYKKYNLDVIEQRLGKGFHFFGSQCDLTVWRDWYAELKHINEQYPPLTLRITKKFPNEVFERPIYHEAKGLENWARSLMHFLNKEKKGQNSSNLWKAIDSCGLQKWFKCVVYGLCPICLISSPDSIEEHMKKVHYEDGSYLP